MDAIKGCILVVEDDIGLRGLIVCALEEEGYCVLSAMDGREALKMLRMVKYCVVLLDITLPDLTGTEVVKWINDMEITSPVILMTGHTQGQHLAAELDVAGYLPKPFELHELFAAVEGCIKQPVSV